VVVLVVLAVLAAGAAVADAVIGWISVRISGLANGDIVRGDQVDRLQLGIVVHGPAAGRITVALNGVAETPTRSADGQWVVPIADAASGDNVITYRVSSTLPWVSDATGRVSFTVRFGPSLSLPRSVPPPTVQNSTLIRGLASDDTIVTVNGKPASRESGMFEAYVAYGARNAVVVATDANGNVTREVVNFDATPVVGPPVQAFYVSESSWNASNLAPTLTLLAQQKRINAVVLTVKDDNGLIAYDSAVPLATQIGSVARDYTTTAGQATAGLFDARAAVAKIHSLGLKAIARVSCFLDPQLAGWAIQNNKPDMTIQDAGGQPLRSPTGAVDWTNFTDAQVAQYNIQIAVEAAKLGFDEILLDDVRQPDPAGVTLTVPGLSTSAGVAIAQFVRQVRQALPTRTKLGVTVLGISASRPKVVGQDLRLLAPLVDYLAPQVYPGSFSNGEYRVPVPMLDPAAIVSAATADVVSQASTGGAYTVAWIQDYDAKGVTFGATQVAAQINAAYRAGASGVFVWNPKVQYHYDGFVPLGGHPGGATSGVSVAAASNGVTAVTDTTGA